MKIFKSVVTAILLVASCSVITSCSGDGELSDGKAKKLIKKELMFDKNYATGSFDVGFYEASEAALTDLARLQAAGMITFKTTTVIEKRQKSNYSWYGRSYYTVDVEHVFAEVALTEEGQKLVVETPARKTDEISKLLAANDDYEAFVPDYMSVVYSGGGEPIMETVVEEVAEVEEAVADSVEADTVVVEEVAPAPAPAPSDPNAAYNAALARVNTTTVQVLLGNYKFIKAYNVLCTKDMMEKGMATCKFIYTFENETPFGYVLGAPKQGYNYVGNATFVNYSDRGWVIGEAEE